MSTELEAVADAATGAVIAQAVNGTGKADHGEHGGVCLNCGASLTGPHCHGCGQSAHVHRTATALFHDVAHGVFHLEGRTWHTLPLLFWRPGELTRRYVQGERVKFVSPMALFLFSVFLMVAVFGMVGGPFKSNIGAKDAISIAKARTEAAENLRKTDNKIATLTAQKLMLQARAGSDPDAMAEIDEKIGDLRAGEGELQAAANRVAKPPIKNGNTLAENFKFHTGIGRFDRMIDHAASNPELAAYRLQSSAHKFSWALVPISLPFIWLLFAFRRDVGMYDHAIFATYSLSAMTLLVVALSIANMIGIWSSPIWLTLLFFPPWHMYRQLKGAYGLSRFGAWWRMIALVISAYTSALIFFILIVAVEAGG